MSLRRGRLKSGSRRTAARCMSHLTTARHSACRPNCFVSPAPPPKCRAIPKPNARRLAESATSPSFPSIRSAIMRCGSGSTTCIPPASIPGRFCAISESTPSGAFRIISTICRPRAWTATSRACAKARRIEPLRRCEWTKNDCPRMLYPRKKRRTAFLTCAALLVIVPLGMTTAFAQLRGHGGPVRALAISSDGQTAVTGSFDSTAIRWSLTRNAAEQVLRFHADAVNAVVLLRDGRAATAGADGRIAIWTPGNAEPDAVLEGHTAPIAALALSPDGAILASASWDQTVRLWPLAGGVPRVLEGHTQNVNGVAFAPHGRTLVSVSYDQSVRIWPLSGPSTPTVVAMPSPLNAVAVGGDGEITAGGADGKLYFLNGSGAPAGEIAAGPRPVISIAISPDGALMAAAGIGGSVAVIDRKTRDVAGTLVGPGLPVWSVAFLPDSRTLLTGGADNIIRRWDAVTGDPVDPILLETAGDPLAAYAGDHGAEVFRACVACHTLNAEQANKAGPTLAGIFGRRIATLPGYNFSEGLKRLDIVWTPETVSRLFEIGPSAYTPGTKMPEQRIGSDQDRAALVQFLERATKR